jgi:hypothetical protein
MLLMRGGGMLLQQKLAKREVVEIFLMDFGSFDKLVSLKQCQSDGLRPAKVFIRKICNHNRFARILLSQNRAAPCDYL